MIRRRTTAHYDRRRQDGYEVSTDRARLDLDLIHRFLERAYWSSGVPRHIVERSIEHSLAFGVYDRGGAQVGFARVVSDFAAFAYLADVFVIEGHRGKGLGVWLVESVLAHPDLRSLRRIALATADAHGLYERFGFGPPATPEIHMFIERDPGDLYRTQQRA